MPLPSNIEDEIWASAKAYAKSKGYKEIGYASLCYKAGATEYAEWKLKYDELKAEKEKADKMLQYCSKLLENKKEEHAALKDKAQKLAGIVEKAIDHFTILNSILSEFNQELSVSPKWVTEGQQALAEWKEGKV